MDKEETISGDVEKREKEKEEEGEELLIWQLQLHLPPSLQSHVVLASAAGS